MFDYDYLHICDNELLSSTARMELVHRDKYEHGTAYSLGEKIRIRLYIKRAIAASRVSLQFYSDEEQTESLIVNAEWQGTLLDEDIYYAESSLPVGLHFFLIKAEGFGTYYGYKDGTLVRFSRKKEGWERFQITVSEFEYDKPKDVYGGVIYHIFVDRFCRGGSSELRDDAVVVDDWYSDIPEFPKYPGAYMKNNSFFGGTLYGIAKKLDYLSSLGVTIIYLSPIFESPSNHKYDTADYMKVDTGFGGDGGLIYLIKECKKRGIEIILDGVFNHTGSDSIYFNKNSTYASLGAYQSKSSKYYNWYEFKAFPNEYTCWWGIDILPRINSDNKNCADFFIGNGGVVEKYSKLGILGFRLDVADELSDLFIAGIKSALERNADSPSLLYGEVWEDASNKVAYNKRKQYYLGRELDGVMNYPLREGIVAYIKAKDIDKLSYAFEVLLNMPKRIRDATMNLLGTHDTERIITVLGGEDSRNKINAYLREKRMTNEEYSLGKQRLIAAYTVIATLPGIPAIFYGDEAGLEGYSDPFNRRSFPWGKEDREILSHYSNIGKIRRENDVYKEGSFKVILLTAEVLVFERRKGILRYLTFFNNSEQEIKLRFEHLSSELVTMENGREFIIKPLSASVFKTTNRNRITTEKLSYGHLS